MSSPTTTPPVADDIAYVLGLPADRQSAVLSALVRQLSGERTGAAIPVTAADGNRAGTYLPNEDVAGLEALLRGLSPEARARFLRPLPPDFDPDDYLSDEEMEAIRAETRPR